MRDVDDRDAELAVERAQLIEDGRAQRRVDHRHRLVGHDQARLEQHRAGDHDALALAAAELVREAPEGVLRPEPDRVASASPISCAPRLPWARPNGAPASSDMVDSVERIEDVEGVLENRLHLATELARSARHFARSLPR